jgi:hypothetical protein
LSDSLASYGTGLAQDHYNGKTTFYGGLECEKILLTSAIILAGLSAGYARAACIASAFATAANHIGPPQRRRFSPLGGRAASDQYSV